LCAYGAIGLFMSTITHYQVVAVIGTLVVLATLNYIGKIGQDTSFVRDITYWLSIAGRSESLLSGMLSSKDIIYFILVISLFIALSVIKLQGERLKVSKITGFTKYSLTILIVLSLGYVTSRPMMSKYYDASFHKENTLTRESQEVVAQLDGGLTITTYVNFLCPNYHKGSPSSINSDKEKFEKYIRFKPEIKMEYVYYYDSTYNSFLEQYYTDLNTQQRFDTLCKLYDNNPKMYKTPLEIKKIIDLSGEGNRFVRVIERENGNKTFLRIFEDQQCDPFESEITSALKTLIVKSPKVGFVNGHGERNTDGIGDRSYSTFATSKPFRHSLVNQGFRVENIDLNTPIAEDMDIIVISDMRTPYNEKEMSNFEQFLQRGGNMIILGEPRRQENMNPLLEKFGLKFTNGIIVQPVEKRSADLLTGSFTNFAMGIKGMANMIARRYCVTMPSTCGIETIGFKGFELEPLIVTADKGVWNEMETTNFIDDTPTLDKSKGEIEKSYDLMVYAKRYINNKKQRVFIIGDADCISSGEISITRKEIPASNYNLIISMFQELSYDNFPITTTKTHPRDNSVSIDKETMSWIAIMVKWVFPS
ncbi:MAG: GldG family protein, partial [Rikenellaceae bacterium]